MDRDEWIDGIAKNGVAINLAMNDAIEDMGPDADLGNALAFAVSIAIAPSEIEAFIDSLRTFSAGRKSAVS